MANAFEIAAKKYGNKRMTRAKAIKIYCKEQCCCGDMKSWQECSVTGCLLWRFRKGKEILGNSTSFNKTTARSAVLKRKTGSGEGGENG